MVAASCLVAVLAIVLGCAWLGGRSVPVGERFADQALKEMDAGWFANGERWRDARARALAETRGAETEQMAVPAVERALRVAGGKHSFLLRPESGSSEASSARPLPSVRDGKGVTTIVVPDVMSMDETFLARYRSTLAEAIHDAAPSTTCGWIVDLRGNLGGNYQPMLAGLSPLVSDGKVAEFRTHTDSFDVVVRGGDILVGSELVTSVASYPKSTRPIAILQDRLTASSGEVVLAAFDGQANVRSFGEASAGWTTVNKTIILGPEFEHYMLLTEGLLANRDGRDYGTKVAGQIYGGPVPVDTVSFKPDSDAQTWLQAQC